MKQDMLYDIVLIIKELESYWPLTLRQIYYQLVSKELIPNKQAEYKSLSRLLVKAREDNCISWDCMIDRTRNFYKVPVHNNYRHFVNEFRETFSSNYYWHNMMENQNKKIEIWIEKDALSEIFKDVINQYSIDLVVCKGYPSKTFLNDFVDRNNSNIIDHKRYKQTLILYFGDLDASGINIFDTTKKYFEERITNFDMKRYALTLEQVEEFNLPHSPDSLKQKDSRTKKYIEKYGQYAVELDSLHPDILTKIIHDAIRNNLDLSKFKEQIKIKEDQINKIDKIKDKLDTFFERGL
jgi:hypothetical protein